VFLISKKFDLPKKYIFDQKFGRTVWYLENYMFLESVKKGRKFQNKNWFQKLRVTSCVRFKRKNFGTLSGNFEVKIFVPFHRILNLINLENNLWDIFLQLACINRALKIVDKIIKMYLYNIFREQTDIFNPHLLTNIFYIKKTVAMTPFWPHS